MDLVLEEVGRELQITATQFDRAEQAYTAVATWLQAAESPLAGFRPEVYPQGSMALRTTVKPLREEEFDLDLVVQVDGWSGSAMDLYDATGSRLAAHGTYRQILEAKKRCWRLNYSGDFHLDALPGRDDLGRAGNAIEIPDRELRAWKPTNPRDYVAWFDQRAQSYHEARGIAPLAPSTVHDDTDSLRRAVQLMKRHRDVRFEGSSESAPRSVVLTTLAGKYFGGKESIGESLLTILAGISDEISTSSGPFPVPNPVNEDENFADAWERDPAEYVSFVGYVEQFQTDFAELVRTPMSREFRSRAAALFGESVTDTATNRYHEEHSREAEAALHRVAVSTAGSAKPWAIG